MGTSVTTNLELIKPDSDEFIKENLPTFPGWAAQNEFNMDTLDALFRKSTHTYTPAWTATTTNPTLGAGGFVDASFVRLFPRMVICHFRIFTGGAGFAAGTGTYLLSLPTGIASEFTSFFNSVALGKAILLDNDTVLNCSNMEVLYDVGTAKLYMRTATGSSFGATIPITLAQNDRVSGYFIIPTSDV